MQHHRATWGRRSSIRRRLAAVSVRTTHGSFGRYTNGLDACPVDVEAWLKVSGWLRLKPNKTQVNWLGSAQQLAKVRLDEIPLLASQGRRFCKEPRCRCKSAVNVCTCFSCLSWRLLSAAVVATTQEMHGGRCHQSTNIKYQNAVVHQQPVCGNAEELLSHLESVQITAARLVTGNLE